MKYRGFAGAGGIVLVGAAPTTLVGGQIVLGWRVRPRFSVELDIRATFPAKALPLEATPVLVDPILSVAAAPCYRIGAFGACGVVMGGNIRVETLGLNRLRTDTASFAGVGARVLLEKQLAERWSVRIDAEITASLLPPAFDDDTLNRWTGTPFGGNASVSFFAWF